MNHYTWADMQVGLSESFSTTITQEKMRLFYEATGDNSPIHMSDAAAKSRGHEARVVYGMLGAGFFSTLAGVYLPGSGCLLHSVEAKFVQPVYIGDVLTVSGTVSEVNETFKQVTIRAVITNQNGKKVTRGIIKAGVEEPIT